MEKQWKIIIIESCPNCGDALEVLSECPESEDIDLQWFVDGEEVRCTAHCGFESCMSADEGGAWVQDGNIEELQNSNN